MPAVEKIVPILQPFKLAGREFQPETSQVRVGNVLFGGTTIPVIAGPCAVESEEQLLRTADRVKEAGASMLRGGAFKPRTSPYTFQGLEEEGLCQQFYDLIRAVAYEDLVRQDTIRLSNGTT